MSFRESVRYRLLVCLVGVTVISVDLLYTRLIVPSHQCQLN